MGKGYPYTQSFYYKPYIQAPNASYFSPYALTPYGSTVVFSSPGTTYIIPARPVFAPAPLYPYPYGGYAYTYPARQWVPGAWSYMWVPQIYTYQVWTPGYHDDGGTRVDGRYETRTVDNGYYQKVWVDGHWTEDE